MDVGFAFSLMGVRIYHGGSDPAGASNIGTQRIDGPNR